MNVLLNKLADDNTYGEVSVLVEQILLINEIDLNSVDLLENIYNQLDLLTVRNGKFQKLLEKIKSHLQSP